MLRQVALFCVWLMLWPLHASQTAKPTLKEQVVLINSGSVIEVVLKNKETTTRTLPFDQVKKVKQQRDEGMGLGAKIAIGVLAGLGVWLLISLIAVAASGGFDS